MKGDIRTDSNQNGEFKNLERMPSFRFNPALKVELQRITENERHKVYQFCNKLTSTNY